MADDTHWMTWHLLHATPDNTPCRHKCGDPMCDYVGCMDRPSLEFRSSLISGVRQHRADHDDKYPFIIPSPIPKICSDGHRSKCIDPICEVLGCLETKAWKNRALIKMGLRGIITTTEFDELE